MRVLGCSSVCAAAVLAEVTEAAFSGRAFVLVSDGPDITGVIADHGDKPDEVARMALRLLPDVGART